MIHVLYCIDASAAAGAGRQVAQIAARLDRTRFRPVVFCLRCDEAWREVLRKARVELLEAPRCCRLDASVAAHLLSLSRRRRFEIIHIWTRADDLVCRTAAWFARTPVILTTRRFAERRRVNDDLSLDLRLTTILDAVVCNSRKVLDHNRDRLHIPPRLLLVIPDGVDVASVKPARSREDVRRALGVPADAPLLTVPITGGRGAEPDLGMATIEAIRRCTPDAHVVLVPPERRGRAWQARPRRDEAGDHVHAAPAGPAAYDFIAASDLYVLCAPRRDMVAGVLEAVCLGVPVLSANFGGANELIIDDYSGRIIDRPLNGEQVAREAMQILAAPDGGRSLADNARQNVLERYSFDRVAVQYAQLYERLLSLKLAGAR